MGENSSVKSSLCELTKGNELGFDDILQWELDSVKYLVSRVKQTESSKVVVVLNVDDIYGNIIANDLQHRHGHNLEEIRQREGLSIMAFLVERNTICKRLDSFCSNATVQLQSVKGIPIVVVHQEDVEIFEDDVLLFL